MICYSNLLMMSIKFESLFPFLFKSPLFIRLAHGALWGFLTASSARIFALISSFFIARLLGRIGFGEWGIIQTTIGMFGVLSGLGIGITATKFVAQLKSQDPHRTGRIIGLSLLITISFGTVATIVFWVLAPWLAAYTLNAANLADSLRIGALLLFFTALDESQKGILAGFEEFKLITRIVFWAGIISFPMTLGGVYWKGLNGGIWALAINAFLMWFLNLIGIRKVAKNHGITISYKGCIKERSILWSFSLPALLGQSLVIPINWACFAILANQTDGYRELGLFNAANQWRAALLFIPYAAGRIILPVLSDLYTSSSIEKFKKVFRKISIAFIALGGIGFIVISLLSRLIMKGYGKEFLGGEKVIYILAFTAFCATAIYVNNQLLYSTNKIWFSVISNIALSIILLGMAMIFVPRYGAIGLAVSLAIANFCEAIWKTAFIKINKWI